MEIPTISERNIQRIAKQQELEAITGINILAGESGSGKSTLVRQILAGRSSLPLKNQAYIYSGSYKVEMLPEETNEYSFIIFDQFERAFQNQNVKTFVEKVERLALEGKSVLLVMRKEYIGDAIHAFSRQIPVTYLDNGDVEQERLENWIRHLFDKSKHEFARNDAMKEIIDDFFHERLTFIQLKNLCLYIIFAGMGDATEAIKKSENDYDKVIKDFFTELLDSFPHKEEAKEILYSMASGIIQGGNFRARDFQNVALCDDTALKETVAFLSKTGWIKALGTFSGNYYDGKYEIAHDYYRQVFRELLIEDLNVNIRNNIDYYLMERQREIANQVDQDAGYAGRIQKNCKRYFSEKNKRGVHAWLVVLLIANAALNALFLMRLPLRWNGVAWELSLIQIVLGESVFYTYNYYVHFLAAFQRRRLFSVILLSGIPASLGTVYFNQFWGVFLGVEIVLTGVIMLRVSQKVRPSEKSFFKERFAVFSAIGLIVTILGYFFPVYTQGKIGYAWPMFLIYAIYMALAISGRLKESNIRSLLGKAMYE